MDSDNLLILSRFLYTPNGVFGDLILPDGWRFYTAERPWLNNAPNVSCIPTGEYRLALRRSGVVERSTGGEFLEGWEITNVPGRTFIMIHPGNTMHDLQGCVAVGDSLGYLGGNRAVLNSRKAFRELMGRLAARDSWRIVVDSYRVEVA